MEHMEFDNKQRINAKIFALLQGLVPVEKPEENKVVLVDRDELMARVSDLEGSGRKDEAYRLLVAAESLTDDAFKNLYSQMASKSVRIRTSTMFHLIREAHGAQITRSELVRQLLLPTIIEFFNEIRGDVEYEKARLVHYCIDNWRTKRKGAWRLSELENDKLDEYYEEFVRGGVLKKHQRSDQLKLEFRDSTKSFLRSLFRLNNLDEEGNFIYSPEVVEKYWDLQIDPAIFEIEATPSPGSLRVLFYNNAVMFKLKRSGDPEDLAILELLALERRNGRIHNFRLDISGLNEEEDDILREALDQHTSYLVNGEGFLGLTIKQVDKLPEKGREKLRQALSGISGLFVESAFPIVSTVKDEDGSFKNAPSDVKFNRLEFSLSLAKDDWAFLLDDVPIDDSHQSDLNALVRQKLLRLSKYLYKEPWAFPPIEYETARERYEMMVSKVGRNHDSQNVQKDILVHLIYLDFYDSISSLSELIGAELFRFLSGTQVLTFTIPRVLLAFLEKVTSRMDFDEVLLQGLEKGS